MSRIESQNHRSRSKRVKASHTHYRALGRSTGSQPADDYISHPPGGRLLLLSAKPAVTFPAAKHDHRPLAGTKLYCLVTEAQV